MSGISREDHVMMLTNENAVFSLWRTFAHKWLFATCQTVSSEYKGRFFCCFFLVCYKVWLSVRFNKLTTDFHISQTHRLWMKPLSYELFGSASLIWSFKPKKKYKYIRPADGWKVFVLLRGNTAPTWLSCTMTLCSSDLAKHYYLETCY